MNRLRNLQNIVSSTDDNFPYAIAIIPGIDGRYNKGSLKCLKYLFQGSTGDDLFRGSIEIDSMEDMVFVIQETSVSVFWNSEVKAAIGDIINSSCPSIIEYVTTKSDELEVDRFQSRKCRDFKRMILESVPPGKKIGLPVPIGYDEVSDVESWPLLQVL